LTDNGTAGLDAELAALERNPNIHGEGYRRPQSFDSLIYRRRAAGR
jgi:hypothetical protein